MKLLRLFLSVFLLMSATVFAETLLINILSRGDSDLLVRTLDQYTSQLSGEVNCRFVVTCEGNELKGLKRFPHVNVNSPFPVFDYIMVAKDDQVPTLKGFDKLIVKTMQTQFPQCDGVLNFQVKDTGKNLNTLPVLGKNYYDLFGYVYNPEYKTLSWAQEELTMVSRMLGREYLIIQDLFSQSLTQEGGNEDDRALFGMRFYTEFGISDDLYRRFLTKDWSILICTLDEREEMFSSLYHKLKKQIKSKGLEDKIEVLYFKDNRQFTIGYKRNALMRWSKGLYVNFIDDDDEIHENYIDLIYDKLNSSPDCVSLVGIITFNGLWAQRFIHSLQYKHYYKENDVFYRPPNHISVIKRSIASRFPFLDISYGEDFDWAMNVCNSNLLQTEASIETPYYFYKYVDK